MKKEKHLQPTMAHKCMLLIFLGVVLVLTFRSFITQDMRFGWGMFATRVAYTLDYALIDSQGNRVPLPKDHAIKTISGPLYAGKIRYTRYGVGSIRSWVESYARYVHKHLLPGDEHALHVVLGYRSYHEEFGHREEYTFYP